MSMQENNPVGEEVPVQSEEVAPARVTVEFYVTDANNEVVRSGECPENLVELQAFNQGEVVHLGQPPVTEAEPMLTTHVIPRQLSYPSVTDQLDAIWKILARNPDALGVEGNEMLERIRLTKETFPKGVLYTENQDEEVQSQYVPINPSTEN